MGSLSNQLVRKVQDAAVQQQAASEPTQPVGPASSLGIQSGPVLAPQPPQTGIRDPNPQDSSTPSVEAAGSDAIANSGIIKKPVATTGAGINI